MRFLLPHICRHLQYVVGPGLQDVPERTAYAATMGAIIAYA